jgi:hypothetical protein
MKKLTSTILLFSTLALGACTGGLITGGRADGEEDVDGEEEVDESQLVGAGGRDLMQFWPNIDVPFSENTKMLAYPMMRSEVIRATSIDWADWEANRELLGGADYQNQWVEDRTPSQQKFSTWRRMALDVCLELVDKEAGQSSRTVFTAIDPGEATTASDPKVREQVTNLFERFFIESPSETEIVESIQAFEDLDGANRPKRAWRGLCAAYLSSMRFLSY